MKRNGFISKQLQKMLAPTIDECLHICYDIIEQFSKKEFMSYDDYTNLCNKVAKYEDSASATPTDWEDYESNSIKTVVKGDGQKFKPGYTYDFTGNYDLILIVFVVFAVIQIIALEILYLRKGRGQVYIQEIGV